MEHTFLAGDDGLRGCNGTDTQLAGIKGVMWKRPSDNRDGVGEAFAAMEAKHAKCQVQFAAIDCTCWDRYQTQESTCA
jgi:hypothetical protein